MGPCGAASPHCPSCSNAHSTASIPASPESRFPVRPVSLVAPALPPALQVPRGPGPPGREGGVSTALLPGALRCPQDPTYLLALGTHHTDLSRPALMGWMRGECRAWHKVGRSGGAGAPQPAPQLALLTSRPGRPGLPWSPPSPFSPFWPCGTDRQMSPASPPLGRALSPLCLWAPHPHICNVISSPPQCCPLSPVPLPHIPSAKPSNPTSAPPAPGTPVTTLCPNVLNPYPHLLPIGTGHPWQPLRGTERAV